MREGAKDVICYKCKKLVMSSMLSSPQRQERKMRVVMATMSQSKDSSKDEKEREVANMCLKEFDDLDEVNSNSHYAEFLVEYKELLKDINKVD